MMRRTRRIGMLTLFVVVALVAMLMVGVGVALADPPEKNPYGSGGEEPFLCPAVGAGVLNAPFLGVLGPLPGGQYTFLPGNNQSGAHANSQALNVVGPGEYGPNGLAGPGNGNSDWSPIWPYH